MHVLPPCSSLASPVPEQRPDRAGPTAPPRSRVALAVDQAEVRAAQRLRVFAAECGARLDGPEPGLDSDAFDAYGDHLLVRESPPCAGWCGRPG